MSDPGKVLLIGSGPIQIGQAAEFDYSGSQACRALREEGAEVVLVNSNPATIMTDPDMADRVYVEPITPGVVAKIIEREGPDGVAAGLGGQTGLNVTAELAEMGVLEEHGVEVLGTPLETIFVTEDRQLFKEAMEDLGEPVCRSHTVGSVEGAVEAAGELGYPVIVRPAYTLGGYGGGSAADEGELREIASRGVNRSRIDQVLVEESVEGWKELEYEVMRDSNDTCLTVVNMENLDPMGIHTGESVVVAPSQTLTDAEHQRLRTAAIRIIRVLGIEGGCNIQFALRGGEYRVVEVNPRVSRSSALASKATGYPIARIAAKIAMGQTLDEIPNDITGHTRASFEPAVDYCVVKIPRWPFDKFTGVDTGLTTAMKSTGEVMAIGRTFEEALLKAVRGLDVGEDGFLPRRRDQFTLDEAREIIENPTHERLFAIYDALDHGVTVDEIHELSGIDPWFLHKIDGIRGTYRSVDDGEVSPSGAKLVGVTDGELSRLTGSSREEVSDSVEPAGFKMVDTCAAEFEAETPYFYSSREPGREGDLGDTGVEKVLILGSGPIRIGQGIEFDYCCTHAVQAMREEGIGAHIVNNNPETVSTDFDTSDRLFFEPVTLEDVMNVVERERPDGVMVQFGGQTSVNLALPLKRELERRGLETEVLGTPPEKMDEAEDRDRFVKLLEKLDVAFPVGDVARSLDEALAAAERIGYPLLVRPSYVLGGRAMDVVYDREDLTHYVEEAIRVSPDHPVLLDQFLEGAVELDVDAVSDGEDVVIGAVMEHVEEAGVHSGDSACVTSPISITDETLRGAKEMVRRLALELETVGLINVQLAVKDGEVYVLEANPRASRTVPYVSKATGVQLAKVAAKVMCGSSLRELGVEERRPRHFAVKEVVLPFDKLPGVDPVLGPEMKSTGEVMGIDADFGRAYYKAELAAGNPIPLEGTVFLSVRDADKVHAVEAAERFDSPDTGFVATSGTARALEEAGLDARVVKKFSEGSPNVVDLMRRGEIDLVVNTPRSTGRARKDGYEIRRAAVDLGVPYITTMQAAVAAASAAESLRSGDVSVKSLEEYLEGDT
ncbi:MAG: Pyruvate carboxylase subunit A [Methanonatronarchaeales archaeon]|nr:Pyruvate carboxylase subunit A [Methanonatronarchaeales archaeon]